MRIVVEAVGLGAVDRLNAETSLLLQAEWLRLRSRAYTTKRSGEEKWWPKGHG